MNRREALKAIGISAILPATAMATLGGDRLLNDDDIEKVWNASLKQVSEDRTYIDLLLKFPKGSRVEVIDHIDKHDKTIGRCGIVKDHDGEFEWVGVQLDGRWWTDWFRDDEIQTIP